MKICVEVIVLIARWLYKPRFTLSYFTILNDRYSNLTY